MFFKVTNSHFNSLRRRVAGCPWLDLTLGVGVLLLVLCALLVQEEFFWVAFSPLVLVFVVANDVNELQVLAREEQVMEVGHVDGSALLVQDRFGQRRNHGTRSFDSARTKDGEFFFGKLRQE